MQPCDDTNTKSGKLLIRRDGNDTGQRPLRTCTDYWSSPDVFLKGGVDLTHALQGVPNTIHVRVKNISTVPLDGVQVEAWVCDFTAGDLPIGKITPPGKVSGFLDNTLIPNASADIPCDPTWTPTAAQVAINDGHVCIAANAFASSPVDGKKLGAGETLLQCCDTHHAQCNIHIVGVQPAHSAAPPIMFHTPKKGGRRRMVVQIRPISGKAGFGLAERQVLRSHRDFGQLKISLSRRKPRDYFLEGKGIDPAERVEIEVDPRKGTQLRMHVSVDPDTKPGTLQLYDINSFDQNGEVLIGGARLLVVAV